MNKTYNAEIKQKEAQRNWYYQHGKKWMKDYMKEYYEENKGELRLAAKEQKLKEKGYDRTNKNKIRENLINIIERYKINKILTLESEDFIFSNLLSNKKIIVFENDKTTFNKMEKSKPKNVSLFYGDISKFASLDSKVDCIYLDFKGIYEFTKGEIFKLKKVIKQAKLFAVTFSLRIGNIAKERGFKQFGDYQFDLIRRLQELLEINFKVVYGEAYKDIQPMVTIVFENPGVEE